MHCQPGKDQIEAFSVDEQSDDAIVAPLIQLTVTANSPMRWVMF